MWGGTPPLPGTLWFDLLPTADRDTTHAIQSTCIPLYRYSQSFTYATFDYSGGGGGPATITEGEVVIQHGGVCVVELPDGTWLMLLQRRVMPGVSDVDGYHTVEDAAPDPRAITFADIIAYRASDSSFTTDVEGPYWIVDARDAWRPRTAPDTPVTSDTGTPIRLRAGVPGAVVVGDELFVYYPVTQSYYFVNDVADLDKHAYDIDLADLGFEIGIGLKRILISELIAWDPGEDADWDARKYGGSAVDYCVPGTVCDLIRVWVDTAEADPVTSVTPFDDVPFDEGYHEGVTFIDPAPVLCGDTIVLFTPATKPEDNPTRDGVGMGLWRLTSIPVWAALLDADGMPVSVQYGVDFIARRSSDWIADVVYEGTADGRDLYAEWQNPAPAQLPDGSWRVYSSGPEGWMHVWVGEERDGCETPEFASWGEVEDDPEAGGARDFDVQEPRSNKWASVTERGGIEPEDSGGNVPDVNAGPGGIQLSPRRPRKGDWIEDETLVPEIVDATRIRSARDPRAPNIGRLIEAQRPWSTVRGWSLVRGGPLGVQIGGIEVRLVPPAEAAVDSHRQRAAAAIGRLAAMSRRQARATDARRRLSATARILPLPDGGGAGDNPQARSTAWTARRRTDTDPPCGCER